MPKFRAATKQPSIHVLTIELVEVSPRIWRTVEVPGHFTLHELHYVIQDAMGWTNSHLHSFRIGRTTYAPPDPDSDLPCKDSTLVTVDKIASKTGKTFQYLYDFGDDWVHAVRVDEVRRIAKEAAHAKVVAGARACPPEDCGGPHGYAEVIAALRNPKTKRGAETREWLRDLGLKAYDPEVFDLRGSQKRVERLRSRELELGDDEGEDDE